MIYHTRRRPYSVCSSICLPTTRSIVHVDGQDAGKDSEARLACFLRQHRKTSDRQEILENVLVKPRKKASNDDAAAAAYITCPSIGEGMTSEFDGLVVEQREDDDCVRILELWEAKASLHPLTLWDAAGKKVSSMAAILEDILAARLVWNGRSLRLPPQPEMPLVGVFGTHILPPAAAAQRVRTLVCQKLLSTNVEVVLTALETGRVPVSRDEVLRELARLEELIGRVRPVIAVPREAALAAFTSPGALQANSIDTTS